MRNINYLIAKRKQKCYFNTFFLNSFHVSPNWNKVTDSICNSWHNWIFIWVKICLTSPSHQSVQVQRCPSTHSDKNAVSYLTQIKRTSFAQYLVQLWHRFHSQGKGNVNHHRWQQSTAEFVRGSSLSRMFISNRFGKGKLLLLNFKTSETLWLFQS